MASSLFSNLNQVGQLSKMINSQSINSIKNMASMLNGNSNPEQMLSMLAGQNPQLGQVMQLLNSKNMSPKDMFMQVAKQQGINADEVINMLK